MTDTATMQRDEQIVYVKTYDLWHRVRAKGKVTEFGDNNEVHLGFFRYYDYAKKNYNNYGGDGLAIWLDESGEVVAAINGEEIKNHYNVFDDHRKMWLSEVLMSCVQDAVSEDYYFTRAETGTWPDQHEAVTKLQERLRERIGGNNPPSDDSYESLEDQINTLAREVNELIKKGAAQSKEDADKAGDLAAALGKLYTKADKAKDKEKRPFLDKCQEIEDKWRPIRTLALVYKRVKEVVINPWQIKADQERVARLRREREEADRLQREADEAQRKANEEAERIADEQARAAQAGLRSQEDEKQAQRALEDAAREADRLQEQAAEASRQADQTAKSTVKVGGTRGRAIALKTVLVVEVKDRFAASGALKDRPGFLVDLDKLLVSYARPLIESGQQVPGIQSRTEQHSA